jgi:hypothetical protein
MKKLVICLAVLSLAQLAGGCGMFGGGKTYDGSEATSEAHPEWSNPPSYMNPDNDYSSNNN